MKCSVWWIVILSLLLAFGLAGCNAEGKIDPTAAAPPPAQVEHEGDVNVFKVDRPEQFPIATALELKVTPELKVTGLVSPDVSRNVPVVSLASGRVMEIHARLGDSVTKGQLLVRVQSNDISAAFSDYRRAQADARLTASQLDRAKLLYDRGAVD